MTARANASHFIGFLQTAQNPNAVLARHELLGTDGARRAACELDKHGLHDVKLEVLCDTSVKVVDWRPWFHESGGGWP